MKKPKRRTTAQVKAEKKRAAKKSYMRKNKGLKKAKLTEARKRYRIEVEKQVQQMMKKKLEEEKKKEGETLDKINQKFSDSVNKQEWTGEIKLADADNKRK